MKCIVRTTGVMLFVTAVAGVLLAERVDMPVEWLYETATHVVVGKVIDIYTKSETEGDYVYTRILAEVRVLACEKGEGLEVGDLVYIRYWRLAAWLGGGQLLPPGPTGHRGLPEEGDIMRIYLAHNVDGGFDVILANGFERLSPEEKEKFMHEEGYEEGEEKKFEYYKSTDLKPAFSFEYPKNWDLRENLGGYYSEVSIIGPRNKDNTFSMSLNVVVYPTKENGGRYGTVDDVVASLDAYKQFKYYREISKTKTKFLGLEAIELTISFMLRLPLRSSKATDTPLQKRWVIFQKGKNIYKLSYICDERECSEIEEAFEHLLKTFQFEK